MEPLFPRLPQQHDMSGNNRNNHCIRERGFIALISVIIISAILLTLIYTLNASSFFARIDTLTSEYKRTSLGSAEACVNAAMLKIAQNSSYSPAAAGDCVSLGGTCAGADPQLVCKICSGTNSPSGQATEPIYVRALYNGTFTNLKVIISIAPSNFIVTNWSETETGSSACTLP